MTLKKLNVLPVLMCAAMLMSAGCWSREREAPQSGEPEIDWGAEVGLDEMIAMAKEGRIAEIEWHVMPNVLRAKAVDGTVYSLRNENKGVDLRSKLIEAGVRIGEGGVEFRHVF